MATVLTLLGRPQVEHEGVTAALHAERRCQLLVLLALRRSWVPRAELAELFWPGHRRELAAANLRKALHHARALPWAAALETQGGAVRMTVDTDMLGLDRAVREGRIADALEHCRGELLDGMDDGASQAWTDWLDSERALHARRVHELTRARLAQLEGRTEPCIALARRMLDADPLDEDAVVALLGAQSELGQWEAQREAYRSYELRLEEELGIEPSQRVRKQLRDGLPAAPASIAGAAGAAFFGRAKELAELAALLARDACRLLTVTGPGGAGKSTLMKHILRRLQGQFADGALWIALDDLQAAGQVPARIAAELQLAPGPQQEPLPLICAHLANRQMLLVFDNGEHLQGLADLAQRLLDSAARLKICVTSRVRLGAQGEWLLPLAGLDVPGPQASAQELLASDGVRMFVASALAARPEFDAQAQTEVIGALVRATDGLPLAILLAADWVRHLSVAEIVQELETSLDVLDGGADEGEERPEHRSMRATVERSWQMLTTREQRLLAALSTFVGGFTRRAALQVTSAPLPLLAALADKSLLQLHPEGRCSLHALIRQFAAETLDVGAARDAARRHAHWFLGWLAQAGSATEAGEQKVLDAVAADLENCRAAWRWAVANAEVDLIAGAAWPLSRFLSIRGLAKAGSALFQEAIEHVGGEFAAPACAAVLHGAAAELEFRLDRLDRAELQVRQAIRLARATRRFDKLARYMYRLGHCHLQRGRYSLARRAFQSGVGWARNDADPLVAPQLLSGQASAERALGRYPQATQLMLEALSQRRRLGDAIGTVACLSNLSLFYQDQGDWETSEKQLEEALALCIRHGLVGMRAYLLNNLVLVALRTGDLGAAQAHAQGGLDFARQTGDKSIEAGLHFNLGQIALRRADLDAARTHLRAVLEHANAEARAPLQLEGIALFGSILAAQGKPRAAAVVWTHLTRQAELVRADREEIEQWLGGLPADATTEVPPLPMPFESLVRRIVAEIDSRHIRLASDLDRAP